MKPLDTAGSPGVIAFQDDLGVAFGEKAVTERAQFGAQLPVVVDAAIEHDTETELVIDHRLLRMLGKIDDLQASMRDRQVIHLEKSAGVRSARYQHGIHGLQDFDSGLGSIEADFSADSTHLGLRTSRVPDGLRIRVSRIVKDLQEDFRRECRCNSFTRTADIVIPPRCRDSV